MSLINLSVYLFTHWYCCWQGMTCLLLEERLARSNSAWLTWHKIWRLSTSWGCFTSWSMCRWSALSFSCVSGHGSRCMANGWTGSSQCVEVYWNTPWSRHRQNDCQLRLSWLWCHQTSVKCTLQFRLITSASLTHMYGSSVVCCSISNFSFIFVTHFTGFSYVCVAAKAKLCRYFSFLVCFKLKLFMYSC